MDFNLDFFSLDHGALVGLTMMLSMMIKAKFTPLFETKWGEVFGPALPVVVAVVAALCGMGGATGVLVVKLKAGLMAGVTASWLWKFGKTSGAGGACATAATKVVDTVKGIVTKPATTAPTPPTPTTDQDDPKDGV